MSDSEHQWPGEQVAEADAPEDEEDTGEQPAVAGPASEPEAEAAEPAPPAAHAPGALRIPDGVDLVEAAPQWTRKRVAVVVSRFNGEITSRLLESALAALDEAGVDRESVTVMPVPGAFELPLGAMALAKTRRYVAIVALGCVIRGETPHFEYVAGEAASGLQLAALETGVPVAFGVLTTDTPEQALARVGKGGDAVRSALEMSELFGGIRASAKAPA